MSDFKIIGEIGESLKRIILSDPWEGISKPEKKDIVFQSPKEIAGENQISIFLFQIMRNSYLTNQDANQDTPDTLQSPPLVLDLYYLITPYFTEKSQEKFILGKIMQIFHDHPVIEGPDFSDSFAGTNMKLQIILHSLSLDDLGKLWTSFHDAPLRLSVCYLVTPVRIDSTQKVPIQRVVVKETDHYQTVPKKEVS